MKNGFQRCLVVAPHPDDETIGAAIWMSRRRGANITLAHITDGCPKDPRYAQAAGFASGEAYACARRAELYAALEIIGIQRKQCFRLGFVDQEVHRRLPELVEQLGGLLHELRPEIVFTPPYEGGHPDHDSTALAMSLAKKLHPHHFSHREYRLYHAAVEGDWETMEFLPQREVHSEILTFSPEESALKAGMTAAFRTQADVLTRFVFADERFRTAPQYDFTRPPHHGELLYEKFGWGISWDDWHQKAHQALVR